MISLELVGHVLFGGFFIIGGMMHFRKLSGMTEAARAKGVPMPKLAVMSTGLLIMFAGLGIVLNMYQAFSYLAIAAFLVVITPIMHAFWKQTDPNMKMVEMQMFMKNMALLGATLAFYAFAA